MPLDSCKRAKVLALQYLSSTYHVNGDRCGWGLCANQPVSTTNTCEAIRTFAEFDALDDSSLTEHRDEIVSFLERSLSKAVEGSQVRTRDIACPMIALQTLGCNTHRKRAAQRLRSLAKTKGGWADQSSDQYASLIPTYHALLALEGSLGRTDQRHYDWLSTLMHTADNLCAFDPFQDQGNIGASSLVLYLFVHGLRDNEGVEKQLACKIQQELPGVFEKMARKDGSWRSYDPITRFWIDGYGHALSSLACLGENILVLSIEKFTGALEQTAFDPQLAQIPGILEISMALRSIKLNYDPFRHPNIGEDQASQSDQATVEAERSSLAAIKNNLDIRQAVIDELQKDVIRQRHEILKAITSELSASPGRQLKRHQANMAFGVVSLLLVGIAVGLVFIWKAWGPIVEVCLTVVGVILIPSSGRLVQWRRALAKEDVS